jgi:hypothetical protein
MNKLEPLAPETEVIIFDPQADFVPGEQIPGKSGTAHTTHKVEMAKWDFNLNDNRFPKEAFELIYSDKDAPQIIQRLVYFALGKGELLLFKRTETQPAIVTITEIEAWKRKNKRKLSNFLWNIATNFYTYGNYFTEYVMTNDRKEVADFHAIDAHNVRAEKVNPNSGRIENYYIATFEQSHDWKKYTIVPAFNEMNPNRKAQIHPAWQSPDTRQPLLRNTGLGRWRRTNDASQTHHRILLQGVRQRLQRKVHA